MVVIYTNNEEAGLRARCVQDAAGRWPGMPVRHCNPRLFNADTAVAAAVAVYVRANQPFIIATYQRIAPQARLCVVPDTVADAINAPSQEEWRQQVTVRDAAAEAAVVASMGQQQPGGGAAVPAIQPSANLEVTTFGVAPESAPVAGASAPPPPAAPAQEAAPQTTATGPGATAATVQEGNNAAASAPGGGGRSGGGGRKAP
jgi:hypothetical protein